MTALSFALTKIIVGDIDRAEHFYVAALGLVRAAALEYGEGDHAFREVILSVPGTAPGAAQLGLVQYLSRPAPPPGEAVVAFMVDDIDTVLGDMTGAGGTIAVPAQHIAEHRLKLAYVADPEGHMVEIMQAC